MATGTYTRSEKGRIAEWDQARLIELASRLQPQLVAVDSIRELDSTMWFGGPRDVKATIREVVAHVPRILAADLSYPIVLSADGRLMDGAHRLAKAVLEGRSHIMVYRFRDDPPPDRYR